MDVLLVDTYVYHVCVWRSLELQELQGWKVVSYHVGAENQTQVPCKSNQCSQLLHHLFSSNSCIFNPVQFVSSRI